jgi:exonuclease SbcD
VDRKLCLESPEHISDQLRNCLPPKEKLKDAVVRLVIEYPREWESMIDEAAVREHASGSFEFHLVKHSQMETRVRLPEGQLAGNMPPLELLETYWKTTNVNQQEADTLQSLAADIIRGEENS